MLSFSINFTDIPSISFGVKKANSTESTSEETGRAIFMLGLVCHENGRAMERKKLAMRASASGFGGGAFFFGGRWWQKPFLAGGYQLAALQWLVEWGSAVEPLGAWLTAVAGCAISRLTELEALTGSFFDFYLFFAFSSIYLLFFQNHDPSLYP